MFSSIIPEMAVTIVGLIGRAIRDFDHVLDLQRSIFIGYILEWYLLF